MMGGTMWFESEEGEGSTFYFEVVFKLSEQQPKPKTELHPAKEFHISIISTSRMLKEMLTKKLANWGFHNITCFSSGEELVTLDHPPSSLVLFDVNAKGIERIKDYSNHIIVVGYTLPKICGTNVVFLKKPVSETNFMHALKRVIKWEDISPIPCREKRTLVQVPKILLAEDNKMNQNVIKKMLASEGYTNLTIVENGKLAVEAVNKEVFDVVLMDIMMPEMGGVEATQIIRKDIPLENQPMIIALTADASTEHRTTYLNSGMQAVLTKPVDIDKLITEINKR